MACLLQEYVDEPADLVRVLKMVLLHDLVEVDAGMFSATTMKPTSTRLNGKGLLRSGFTALPEDQREEYLGLWLEFEEHRTPEARFAVCLDRLQPILQNYHTGGGTWVAHRVPLAKVMKRLAPIKDASVELGEFAEDLIREAIARGYLTE